MKSRTALFISTTNLCDKQGNGGVKASLEHLNMVQDYFGEDNVSVVIFVQPEEFEDAKASEKALEWSIFPRLSENGKLFFAALCGCRVYQIWEEKKIIQYIDDVKPDLLFLDFSILGRLMRIKRNYKTVVFFHNIEADYSYNKVLKEGIKYLPAYWTAKRNDKWATMADKTLCFNERDSRRMYELYGKEADLIIPITIKDDFEVEKIATSYKKEILFLGSMFGPNQDGVEWFIKNVMPKLEGIKLNIVGKGFESKKEEYEKNKNVHVIGTVEKPSDYYYSHAVVVMPIRYGAGMKVKTAEAMMYGKRIFASDEALEGYSVGDLKGVERCNTSDEFVHAINDFFKEQKFAGYDYDVRNYFLKNHEIEIQQEKINNMLDDLLM